MSTSPPLMHATGYTVIGIKDWLRPRSGRMLLLAAFIVALLPMAGHGQSLHERIQADEAQDAANEIIRKERALRSMQQGPDNSGNRPERSGPSAHQVWQEKENARIDRANRANAFNIQAHAAWQRKDFREALRLFRAQQQVIDGPNIKEAIAQTEAQIAWSEATTAAGLRRAIAMQPGFFTPDQVRYVGEVEAQEKRGEIVRQRQQLDRAIGGEILLRINNLALSLDPEPVAALEFALLDSRVVDARQVPTGLPPTVEAAIPASPAGDRVRKGFQAITDHDWKVARAWFQDALNHEPGNPGLQRLVDLAQFTLDRPRTLAVTPMTATVATPAVSPAAAPVDPATAATMDQLMEILEKQMMEGLENPPGISPPQPHPFGFQSKAKGLTDEDWLNQKEEYAGWKNFFRLLTPKRKTPVVDENTPVINSAIRG